jgi:hypothetical protein
MTNTDLYYKKLKDKSVFLYDICNSAIQNLTEEKRKNLEYYYNFQAIRVTENFYIKEPILKKINEQFKIRGAAILILEKNTGYSFHVDGPRSVAINMLISSGISHSFFKRENWIDEGRINPVDSNGEQYKFEELIFEEKTFYLYHTAIKHGVMNFDKPRYMFSIRFDNGDLTYQEVFEWCKQNDLLEN